MKKAISHILNRLPRGRRKLRSLLCDPGRPAHLRFDPSWYVLAYPEVAEDIRKGRFENAEDHYLRVGARQARSPNVFFSEPFYCEENPDVVAAIESGHCHWGFHHFVLSGHDEGRRPNELAVHAEWYLETYGDVAEDVASGRFRDPDEHYLSKGSIEGRDPHPAFSEHWYRTTYEDDVAPLIASGRYLCGYQHFLEYGVDHGFCPHPEFREETYRQRYPDVDTKIRQGLLRSGFHHLISAGLRDGRPWRQSSGDAQLKELTSRRATNDLVDFLASERVMDFTSAAPAVSIVLVLYNRAELTFKCLESLLDRSHPPFELIIFDNASSDLTNKLLSRVQGATIARSEENLGFIKGSNGAAAHATTEALLFLNNDTEVRPGAITNALATLDEDSTIGAVGALTIRLDGLVEEAGCTVWKDGTIHAYGAGDTALSGAYRFRREVDYCSGAFLMVRRDHFNGLNGFSTAYEPAYYEDVDLCFRLRESLGLRTVFEPRAVITHFGSASTIDRQVAEDLARRNRATFCSSHAPSLTAQHSCHQTNIFAASNRAACSSRVLIIDRFRDDDHDDPVCPETREIVDILVELGCCVTLFSTTAASADFGLDASGFGNLEVVTHLGLDNFEAFWHQRSTAYQTVIVIRSHDMERLKEHGITFDDTHLVSDASAYGKEALRRAVTEAANL